jgi:capsid protein
MATAKNKANKKNLGYAAVENKGRRRSTKTVTMTEDAVLKKAQRRALQATTREDARNKSLLAWIIRVHTRNVSQFSPHIASRDKAISESLSSLLAWHARPENFDVAGRFGRDESMFLFEMGKIQDGDCFMVKLKDGRTQAIESDLVTMPSVFERGKTTMQKKLVKEYKDYGLKVNRYGGIDSAIICNRGDDGRAIVFDHTEKWSNIIYDGYFSRFGQMRGISPLASALNTAADVYEAWAFNLLKIKLHALFGIAITRNAEDGGSEDIDNDGTESTEATDQTFDFSNGPVMMDLDEGEEASPIESSTPAPSLIDFTSEMVRVVMLAIDMPFTMYNSLKSSFSARIADRNEYIHAAQDKQRKNQNVLKAYSDWQVKLWLADRSARTKAFRQAVKGMSLEQVQELIEWIPRGVPWMDKLKEAKGDRMAIGMHQDSFQRSAKRRGVDAYQMAAENAEFLDYCRGLDVPVLLTDTGGDVLEDDDVEEDAQAADVETEVIADESGE